MKFKGPYEILFCEDATLKQVYFPVHVKTADVKIVKRISEYPTFKRFELLSNNHKTNSKFVLVEGVMEINNDNSIICYSIGITENIYENELREILFGD